MCAMSITRNIGLISDEKETCGILSSYNLPISPRRLKNPRGLYLCARPADRPETLAYLSLSPGHGDWPVATVHMRHKVLCGNLRCSRALRARRNCAVESSREEASLLRTGLPSKRKIKYLSRRPGCDQAIAHLDRKDLPRFSAGWRNQIYIVHAGRRYLQSCNVSSYACGVLCLSAQKACRRGNDVG